MPKISPTAITQIREIAAKQQQDTSVLSDFEAKFVTEQMVRIDQYDDDTYFSEKQVALIEKIHAVNVRDEVAEVIEMLPNPTSIVQMKDIENKLLIDVDTQFSGFESGFISDQLARIEMKQLFQSNRVH